MRAYVITTGIVFALIAIVHFVRIAIEGTTPLTDPSFLILTIVSASLSIWGWIVLWRLKRLR